jgi:succinate dehydrogenase / fumarate reductase, membrane anchor subunit
MVKYAKNPVGAHYGTGGFLLQRFTAVIMAVYTVVALVVILGHRPAGYAEYKALFAGGFGLFTLLFLAALLYHAWIGVRDILIDYVKPMGVRLALHAIVATLLVFYFIWAAALFWGRWA